MSAYDRGLNSFLMVPHMVYFVILVTIQRQFINVQYRNTMIRQSHKEGLHRGIHINISKTDITSLYFQRCNIISYFRTSQGFRKI